MTKKIPLTRGFHALVDDEDYEYLSQHRWAVSINRKIHYAVRTLYIGRLHQTARMHRVILNAPNGILVDHVDGDGLNNTRANLRLATNAQNIRNSRKSGSRGSQYKGVSLHNQTGRWQVHITINGKVTHVGIFADEIEAALAYDKAAKKHFGEFARLNFP